MNESIVAPVHSREAAILVSLDPGSYTAILQGVGNGEGIGLVEMFAIGAG